MSHRPARPHPQARWIRGQYGVGHVNTHGDVMTISLPQQPDLQHARAFAPRDAYAHFIITPGGHVDARMTGPMGSTEFYRIIQQAHPELAPHWTQDEVPRVARWQTHVSEQWWEAEDEHGNPYVRCKHCGELTNHGNPHCEHCGEPLTPSPWISCPTCGSPMHADGACPFCTGDEEMKLPPGWTDERSATWIDNDQKGGLPFSHDHEDRQRPGMDYPAWHESREDDHGGWSDYHEDGAALGKRRDQARRELRLPGLWIPLLGRRDRLQDGDPWSDVPGLRLVPPRSRQGAIEDPVEKVLEEFPHWQPLAYGSSRHRVWGWTSPDGVHHMAGCGAGIHNEQARKEDAQRLRQRFRRCEAGACNCAPRAAEEPQTPPEAPQTPPERPLVPGDRVEQGWIIEIDGPDALVQDTDGIEDILPVAELRRLPRHLSQTWRTSDYEGMTNWHTWNTKLMMNNERALYDQSRKLIEKGATPEQLRDWAIRTIIGPYNKQQIADAQEWNDIPQHDRLDPHYEELKNKNPQAADIVDALGFGADVDDTEPDLIDPELVNWQEIHDHLVSEANENDEYDRQIADYTSQGLGWVTNHDLDTNRMRDAMHRFHGALPEEESGQSWSEFTDNPRNARNITVPISMDEAMSGKWGSYPEDMISRDTRFALWALNRRRLRDEFMAEHDLSHITDPEEREDRADQLVRWHMPKERVNKQWAAEDLRDDPEARALVEADPGHQAFMQKGEAPRLDDFTWKVMHNIWNGTAAPEHAQMMQQALQQRGYSPQDIASMMRQKWQWNPQTNKMDRLEPLPEHAPDPSLDQPGDLRLPPGWTASTEAPHEGALEPAHPEDVLPPHAEELLHYLRGVSPLDTQVVTPVDTKGPHPADPAYDDDPLSTPDPSPGALTR